MKYNKIIKVGLAIVISVISIICINLNLQSKKLDEKVEKLINIQDYSEEKLNKFVKESKSLSDDNKKNILIISSNELVKDNNATNIIEAPNNQYFVEYANEKEKNKALKKFQKNKKIFAVSENEKYEFYNSESMNSSYNSWGIEATGLDTAKVIANEKELNEVVVGIIDTGLNTSLFNENYDNKIKGYYNAFDSLEMYDGYGHGTHIAGTIAEATPDNVKILPIKVSNSEGTYLSDTITALNYVINGKKVDVLNLSYGSSNYNSNMYVLYRAASNLNITLVAAAGNDSTDEIEYPSGYKDVISVSSIDNNFNLSDFSNYGDVITFAAPGTNINSINGVNSGTSMATPHVVSAVALLKSYNLNYTNDNIIDVLAHYSKDLGEPGKDDKFGYGLINLDNIEYCNESSCKDKLTYFNNNLIDNYDRNNIQKLEIIPESIKAPNYRFNTITDLYNIEVKSYINENDYKIEKLINLPDIEITGYDPNINGLQHINVNYNDKNISFDINWNLTELENAFSYYRMSNESGSYAVINRVTNNLNSSIETLVFPNNINNLKVKAIGNQGNNEKYAISINNIKNVILSENISEIWDSAFEENNEIISVNSLAPSIKIGEKAFKNATNFENFNGNLSSIGLSAFDNCNSLKEIDLGSIQIIPELAFYSTNSLKNVNIPDTVTTIGGGAFYNSYVENLSIGSGVEFIGIDAFTNARFLETISVSLENRVFDSRDNSNAIIKTSENKLIVGSHNTIIPSTIDTIGDYAFYNYKLKDIFFIPEGVEVIEENAFTKNDTLSQIVYPRSLNNIHETNMCDLGDTVVRRFHMDSYAYEYSKSCNQIPYISIMPKSVEVTLNKSDYLAFDTVKPSDYNIDIKYDMDVIGGNMEKISKEHDILFYYQENRNSFRAGDTGYSISIVNDLNYSVEKEFNVTVSKITPSYIIPENLVGTLNEKLSTIILPDNFFWKTPDEVMSHNGNQTYQIKFVPDDTDNYHSINSINVNVNIMDSSSVINQANDYNGVYDGLSHSINLQLKPGNHNVKYSINNLDYNLTNNPSIKEVGEHVINYKIDSDGYVDYKGSNKINIYGIELFDEGLINKENQLRIEGFNNSFSSIKNKINIYSINHSYKHLNSTNNEVDSNIITTNDKIKININEEKNYIYDLIVLGDVYPDGKISALDYVRIKNHIMETKVITDSIIKISADANNDGKISALDYVRIKNHIMKGGN